MLKYPLSISAFISFMIFFSFLNMLTSIENNVAKQGETPKKSKSISNYKECNSQAEYMTPKECDEYIKNKLNDKEELRGSSSDYGFYIIYALLYISLLSQFFIFFKIKAIETPSIHYFYWSEWAINSAPMLGVIGTILSFSLLMSESADGDIQKMFSQRFFEAATTTIMGGTIYILNLLLGISINSRNFLKNSIDS